jgi:NAD(P)-dependent dehydrogenase (short-subunit alcohol dehydrogenase family)
MNSLPDGYRAVIVGASGGIGHAFVDRLRADPRVGVVEAVHRSSAIPIDFDDESSIAAAAHALAAGGPIHLLVNAIGVLHNEAFMPDKKFADLDYARLATSFRINAFGPALLLRHFAPLLDRERAIVALLSAKVGSIGDDRLGGWTAYRASKAALNMIVKNASIEFARSRPGAIVVALHPGTVDTALSRPFGGERIGRPPPVAATEMLAVLDGLAAADSGSFVAYDGARLPW